MSVDEAILWERLARSRRAPLEPSWLEESYSSSLSADLRQALCERLGSLADQGWPIILRLIQQHGEQKELVRAAGLCHQREARDWLLQRLDEPSPLDDDHLCVLQALSCWGADVPESVLLRCLGHPGLQHRLTGLQLISFRAHSLTDQQLLALCSDLLDDCRDPIVISAIRVLQRRDGEAISERLAALCQNNSEVIAGAAFRALGCIATPASQRLLLELSESLVDPSRRELAHRQLSQQFRNEP